MFIFQSIRPSLSFFLSLSLFAWTHAVVLFFTSHYYYYYYYYSFECFCILDLNNLTTSQLSRRALAIIKEQAAIDSICFPETMNKMLIVNAPMFFPPTWRLIKGWLDPRTSSKIEVLSSKSSMEKRLLELVAAEQLPKDYGGKGPDTHDTIQEGYGETGRIATKIMYLRYVQFCFYCNDH